MVVYFVLKKSNYKFKFKYRLVWLATSFENSCNLNNSKKTSPSERCKLQSQDDMAFLLGNYDDCQVIILQTAAEKNLHIISTN
jgi:hypothetical protein